MKFTLHFKTPDVLDYTLEQYHDTHCEKHDEHDPECSACSHLEERSLQEIAEIQECANKFLQYGECLTVEFDTVLGTATVQPIR